MKQPHIAGDEPHNLTVYLDIVLGKEIHNLFQIVDIGIATKSRRCWLNKYLNILHLFDYYQIRWSSYWCSNFGFANLSNRCFAYSLFRNIETPFAFFCTKWWTVLTNFQFFFIITCERTCYADPFSHPVVSIRKLVHNFIIFVFLLSFTLNVANASTIFINMNAL